MKSVPGYSHLVRREAVYWLRRRVPTDVVHLLPFKEWKESLRTKDFEEAKRLLRLRLVEIDREIASAKARTEALPSPPLTSEVAARIANRLFADWLASDEADRLERGEVAHEDNEAWLEAQASERREDLATGNWRKAAKQAEDALSAMGLWYPPGDVSLKRMAGEVLKARVRFDDAVFDRQRGRLVAAPTTEPPFPRLTSGASATLGELIDAYKEDREREHGSESTARKYNHIFKALEEALGRDRPIATVTRAECRGVQETLRKLPAHVSRRYPGLSLAEACEAAAKDGAPLLAPNTVSSYLQNLAAIFNWAVDRDWLEKNPARSLAKKARPTVKRRGFKAEELSRLFESLSADKSTAPWRYWIPALGLYTGARANELCQLHVSDVGREGEIVFINLSEFGADGRRARDKRVKTNASERRVPVHPHLLAAGFEEFVAAARASGQTKLFPELKPGPNGGFSHDLSKWFARACDEVGLTEPSLVFHSFRHGFRDACRWAGITTETAKALGGWARTEQAEDYGDASELELLARESAKISFGMFRLSSEPRSSTA